MKISAKALSLLCAIALSTPLRAQIGVSDTCNCPPPTHEWMFSGGDMMQRLSPDGRHLGFLVNDGGAGAFVLDLQTLECKRIVVHGGFLGESGFGWTHITWCPYDPDLLALNAAIYINDTLTGANDIELGELFTYRVSTGQSTLITPMAGGPYRGAGLQGSYWNVGEVDTSWLPGSKSGLDTFVISYGIYGDPSTVFYGLYVPQTQQMIPRTRSFENTRTMYCVSWDRSDSLYAFILDGAYQLYAGPHQVVFPMAIDTTGNGVTRGTFSPDGKLFAIEVAPLGAHDTTDTIFTQVWVFRSDDPSHVISMINFQKLFCKYSLMGIWPEFITDSTLAVSMHRDGDTASVLWEITVDGRLVRQLTFFPRRQPSIVQEALLPLSDISVSLAHGTLWVSSPGSMSRVVVYDVLGHAVASSDARESRTASMDVGGLPAGVYFVHVTLSTGDVRTIKLAKE
jgi:hypothetical protein